MWKSMLTNWTTSIPAALIALCGATEFFDVLPSQYSTYLIAACAFLTAIGFFAAKSANVSHSGTNAEAHVVPGPVTETP